MLLDLSHLPDFFSYQRIFNDADFGGNWEIFFVGFAAVLNLNGVSYATFRLCICLLGWLTFSLFLHRFYRSGELGITKSNTILLWLIFSLGLAMFLIEYYVIRIRSGMAISFFCLGIFSLLSSRKAPITVFLAFITCSSFVHFQATIVLSVFFIIPLLWQFFGVKLRLSYGFYVMSAIIFSVIFLMLTQSLFLNRGEHLFSPLNSFRVFALGVVPLILYLVGFNEGRFRPRSRNLSTIQSFPKTFIDLYVVMCGCLVIWFLAGFTANSGEALVRIYTLATLPALFSVISSGNILSAPISAYIVVSNAIFQFVGLLLT